MEPRTSSLEPEHRILPEQPADAESVERLIARAFGPGRYAKTAERLREGRQPCMDLSFVAWRGDQPLGCVRLWPIEVADTSALLLGPFAVDDKARGQGLGRALIETACEAARQAGHDFVLLGGDEAYFGPLGFSALLGRRVVMPGPVDQARVLARALTPSAASGFAGVARPRTP